ALPELHGVLSGLAAAAAGMIIATAVKLAEPLVRVRRGPEHAVALATFVAIGVLRLSLPLVLLVMVPASIGFAWRRTDEKCSRHAGRTVPAVRHIVVLRHRRRELGGAGNASSDRRSDPMAYGTPVQRIVRRGAGDAGAERNVRRLTGTF